MQTQACSTSLPIGKVVMEHPRLVLSPDLGLVLQSSPGGRRLRVEQAYSQAQGPSGVVRQMQGALVKRGLRRRTTL